MNEVRDRIYNANFFSLSLNFLIPPFFRRLFLLILLHLILSIIIIIIFWPIFFFVTVGQRVSYYNSPEELQKIKKIKKNSLTRTKFDTMKIMAQLSIIQQFFDGYRRVSEWVSVWRSYETLDIYTHSFTQFQIRN